MSSKVSIMMNFEICIFLFENWVDLGISLNNLGISLYTLVSSKISELYTTTKCIEFRN